MTQQTQSNIEYRLIREQGPTNNRINLTFLGDGYTLDEKEKFFEDVEWATPHDVQFLSNGREIELNGIFHDGRSFLSFEILGPLEAQYILRIQERIADDDNVLGFALVYAFPQHYNWDPGLIGAFSNVDAYGRKSYRPTHHSCLMRDMEKEHFCPIDQENMWLQFFRRVKLIDHILTQPHAEYSQRVEVYTQNLGSQIKFQWLFCKHPNSCSELSELNNQASWIFNPAQFPSGRYKVRVAFESPEIRKEKIQQELSIDLK